MTPLPDPSQPNPSRSNSLKRLAAAYAESVRLKLLTLVLAPLLVGAPVLLMIVWAWGTQGYDQLLVNKVSSDLGTARQYFDRVQMSLRNGLDAVMGLAPSSGLAGRLSQQ